MNPPPRLADVAARPRRLRWWWWAGAGLVAALAVLFIFNPATHGFYPQCLLHRWTGLDCPGCGGLRAAHQLLHGNVAAAFRLNPLVVLALPALCGWAGWRWRRRGDHRITRATVLATWALVGALLAFGVVRNLPVWRHWFAP
jgi:hypothetical protein